jgi:hypothetical protein
MVVASTCNLENQLQVHGKVGLFLLEAVLEVSVLLDLMAEGGGMSLSLVALAKDCKHQIKVVM